MPWRQACLIVTALLAVRVVIAGESGDWKHVMVLPAPVDGPANAWLRWQGALESVAQMQVDDLAALEDDASPRAGELVDRYRDAILSFTLRDGERVSLPRPVGPEGALSEVGSLPRLARLAAVRMRGQWRSGDRAGALTTTMDLVRVGADLCDDACSVVGFLAALGVLEAGIESMHWILASDELDGDERARARRLLDEADRAVIDGVANALRGEFRLVFQVILERMPQTRDPGLLLVRFSTLGLDEAAEEPGSVGFASVAQGQVLLDVPATLDIYGGALARFITDYTAERRWKPERFRGPWEELVRLWQSEIGPLAHHAFHREIGDASIEERRAIEGQLSVVPNSFGKLLLIMTVAPVDGVAGAGERIRERIGSIRTTISP